jgi:hypothetical protein
MPTKTLKTSKAKTFDCVEMKNRIQAQILAEYEARKGEFASFSEFLRATETPLERQFVRKLRKAKKG